MTAQANKPTKNDATVNTSKPPYPFRTTILLILLAGNFLVAAYYFHILE